MIKEFCEKATRCCVIRDDAYGNSLEKFIKFANVANEDFPEVKLDIRVQQFAGDSAARTYGIEFNIPEGVEIPDGYDSINSLFTTF